MKKKQKLRDFLREWDEGNFDFSYKTAEKQLKKRPDEPDSADRNEAASPVLSAAQSEERLFRRLVPVFTGIFLFAVIGFLLYVVTKMPAFGSAETPANTSEVIRRYLQSGLTETGAVNAVAGIILDYRAFDTLGESHVLFTATIAVLILMLLGKEEDEPADELRILHQDLILRNTAKISVPFLFVFGIYIILNGHLGPGGGFSGGAVIGGALILYSTAFSAQNLQKILNLRSYRIIVIAALSFYSIAKCYSFFCGANGLETIFTPGTPGRIFSAGLILPLNAAVGLVVACTMYGFYSVFTRGRI